jgi:hypothetical protein
VNLSDTPPVCGACDDQDPFCGHDAAAVEEQPDPIEELRREYETVRDHLWDELRRHGRLHGCERGGCDLYATLRGAWADIDDMSKALDFVLLGTAPVDDLGRPDPGAVTWLPEYLAGPWPDPSWAHEEFMALCRGLGSAP